MAWRKRLFRSVLLFSLVTIGCGYLAYRYWMDPSVIRQMVLEELAHRLPGAAVELESAELRLLGGVTLINLKLSRRDDLTGEPFAVFPKVVLVHDKEELGLGRLVIRKIELTRPQLLLIRNSDDTTNLQGIAAPSDPNEPLPLLTVQDGTVVFRDRAVPGPAFEILDIDAACTPAGDSWLDLQLTGMSPLFGPAALQGSVNLDSSELMLNYALSRCSVTPALLGRLAAYAQLSTGQLELAGIAEMHGDLAHSPQALQPWTFTLHTHLQGGQLRYPDLPLPLEDLSLLAHVEGGRIVLERLDAKASGAPLHAWGEWSSLSLTSDFILQLRLAGLEITPAIYSKLPARAERFCNDFRPEGKVTVAAEVRQQACRREVSYTATAQGISILYQDFPYPGEQVIGTLVYSEAGAVPTMKIDLSGTASGQPVRLTGEVFGDGLRPDNDLRPGFHLEISGKNLPLDQKVEEALRPYPRTLKAAQEFDPQGRADFMAVLDRQPGSAGEPRPAVRKHFVIHFRDAAVRYVEFPYPLEDVEGRLEVFPDDSWKFTQFKGRHKGGYFTGSATSQAVGGLNPVQVAIQGTNVQLDEEMEQALDDDLQEGWKLFNPRGRVDLAAKVDWPGKGKPELDLTVMSRGCAMKPPCFPYQMNQVQGHFHYAKDKVTIKEFQARHGTTVLTLGDSEVQLRPRNGYRSELRQLRIEPLPIDEEFLEALPGVVRRAFNTLRPDQPVRLLTDLTLDEANGTIRYYWDGSVAFAESNVHLGIDAQKVTGLVALRGSHDGQKLEAEGNIMLDEVTIAHLPLRQLRSPIKVTDDAVVLQGIRANIYGGQLYGPIRVSFHGEPEFHVDVTASKLDLEAFAHESLGRSGQVRGKASARLQLAGRGDDLQTLRGQGWVRIEDGAHLYDLPLILNLLTALSGHLPKGSAFQEANADFFIAGEALHVTNAELLGDALSLRGMGAMRVDGTNMDLEMYGLLWGRTLPLLPPLIDKIPPAVSKQLMKIRVQGSLGDVQVKREPVPLLVEPLKELWRKVGDRMKNATELLPEPRLP